MSLRRIANTLLLLIGSVLPCLAFAAPGDVLFSDNFNDNNLAPWTTTNASISGLLTGGQTSNSRPRAGYTSAGAVSVTSPVINAAVPGASVSLWLRRGSDAISEDTDGGEDLVLEYLRAGGGWAPLNTYLGSGTNGQVYFDSFILPNDALHSGFRLRFRQTGGSGPGFDFYHFDDVVVTEIAPPATLEVGSCDDFESGLANWTVATSGGQAAISSATSNSPSNSLFLNGGTVSVTSNAIDTSSAEFSDLTIWIRRGSDSFSENPDGSENLNLEYRDDTGAFTTLESFVGGGSPGQIFDRRYTLPSDARHTNFQLRVTQVSGSGTAFDFWHVDDVCFEEIEIPDLQLSKLVRTLSDPVNGTSNPKSIPGAIVEYTVTVSNQGLGVVDADSLQITDTLPADTELFVDTGSGAPISFIDGTIPSGLSFDFASNVEFSDQPGGTPFTYAPTAGGDGFDPAVTGLRVSPTGVMAASDGTNNPSFSVRFLVRIRAD